MIEESGTSRSDGEIKSDDEPIRQNSKEPEILQLVFGCPSDNKETVLRQKLLEKKAQLTEANLRQRLLERMAPKEKSPSPVEIKPKAKKRRSRSLSPIEIKSKSKKRRSPSSSSSSSSESTPPKRKKKSHKHKKSKKKSKQVNHLQTLSKKGVLHRVIIRHLNPNDEEGDKSRNKKQKKQSKKKSRHSTDSESEEDKSRKKKCRKSPIQRIADKSRISSNNKIVVKETTKNVSKIEATTIIESIDSKIATRESPIPSPKIFYQHYDEEVEERQFKEGTIEAKPFEDLTEEERAMLSPNILIYKENIYRKELISKLPVYYPGIYGCRSIEEFSILNRIEEGTFGVVYRAQEILTDEIVALKRLKMEKEKDGFPITSLREINMLMKCRMHPNVVGLREVVIGSTMDKIYLVMEYVEHDMKVLLKQMDERKKKFKISEIKTLMQQLLAGCAYLHECWVLHRDLKTSNLLLSSKNVLKIGDFGLSREFGDPLTAYTPVVVTLWYRSPELLLGCKKYSTAVDIWSIGCIFGEFMKLRPIFQGSSEIDQLNKIFMDTGTPNKAVWPSFDELPGISRCVFANTPYNQLRKKFMSELKSEAGLDFMNKLLALDPSRRTSAEIALTHPFLIEEPRPASRDSFPTWPSKNDSKALVPTKFSLPTADKSGLLPLDRNKQQLFDELEIDSETLAKNGFSLNLGIKK